MIFVSCKWVFYPNTCFVFRNFFSLRHHHRLLVIDSLKKICLFSSLGLQTGIFALSYRLIGFVFGLIYLGFVFGLIYLGFVFGLVDIDFIIVLLLSNQFVMFVTTPINLFYGN